MLEHQHECALLHCDQGHHGLASVSVRAVPVTVNKGQGALLKPLALEYRTLASTTTLLYSKECHPTWG